MLRVGDAQGARARRRGDRWYALSKRDGDLGDQMVFWTAPRATGPFTPTDTGRGPTADHDHRRRSPTCRSRTRRSSPQPGTVVASYSNNNTDPQKIKDDPTLYRPTFLRVPLPR